MIPLTCVVYHNIGHETKFEQGLGVTTSPQVFRDQVDWLAQNYNVIDLDTLLSGRLPKRPLLITFDDCYASVLDAVRDVLSPKGLPSVFFVNPGLLGADAMSLDSVLAYCAAEAGLERLSQAVGATNVGTLGELIANDMSKRGASERVQLKVKLREMFQIDSLAGRSPLVSASDLRKFKDHGTEIGSHTLTHTHGRSLSASDLDREIIEAKGLLEDHTGQTVRSFAVPYGNALDLTPALLTKLRETGHRATFLVQARSNRFRLANDVWYRVSLKNDPPQSLKTKLGVLPMLRSIKHMLGP